MRGWTLRACGLAFLFLLVPGAGAAVAQAGGALPLQAQAEQIVAGVNGEWGVMAWSIDRQRALMAIDATRPMTPASNSKVFTAIWALDELGPDYRFPTDLLITGDIAGAVLQGDVILRGSGDPAFGYPPRVEHDLFVEDPMEPLRTMARRLASMGVRAVQGDVVGDATAFDTLLVGPSWPNDTGGGAAQYAPRVSGLAFQRNMIWVEAVRGPGGVQLLLEPAVEVVPVVYRGGGGRALAVRRADEDTVRVQGSVAGRGPYRFGIGVADPALMAADALRHALQEAGIQVQGVARTAPTPDDARHVHRHLSIPLSMMVPLLNQNSDNFFAEHLWKAAAREAVGQGSYVRGGPASALHFMQKAGVPAGELYQFDGSGLSAYSRASAQALVMALVYAHGRPYSDMWHASLALAADSDGTLSRMYRNTAAAGNLHAKTGYIRRVRTLSGYVRAANGELIAFSFLYNGSNTNGARAAQEALGMLLANYGSTGAVEPGESAN